MTRKNHALVGHDRSTSDTAGLRHSYKSFVYNETDLPPYHCYRVPEADQIQSLQFLKIGCYDRFLVVSMCILR